MKKYLMAASGVLLAALILILTQIPIPGVRAASNTSGFTVQGSKLLSYSGSSNAVQIPDTIKKIGPEAFKGNKQISSITIPTGVESIGQGAFYGCNNLEQVIMESGVKEIGGSAFSNCGKLKRVVIPDTVGIVGNGAFSSCVMLSNLEIAAGNEKLFFNDGVLYNKESTELIQYLAGRGKDTYTIPFTVEKIRPYAFWGAGNLKQVEVGNGVKKIVSYAFSNCLGLEKVFMPNSVVKIEASAFSDCPSLKESGLENASVNIHESAFLNSNSSNSIEMNVKKENFLMTETVANDSTSGNTVSGYTAKTKKNNTSAVKKEPYKGIDMTTPGLLGASKVVGGSAFIIMEDGKTVSSTKIEK